MRALEQLGGLVLALGLLVGGWPAVAGEPAGDCSNPALRKARTDAAQAAQRKDLKAAIAAIAGLASRCDGADPVERGWLASDLALYYLKDGQYLECTRLVEEALDPRSDVSRAGNERLLSALDHSGKRCTKALTDRYGPFSSVPCPFAVENAVGNDTAGKAVTALPPALWPAGASAACLAVVAGEGNGPGKVACPGLELRFTDKQGRMARRALRTKGSGLTDATFCCGFDTVAVGTGGSGPLVRLGSDRLVRECSGGSARTTLDEILQWKGEVLTVIHDASTLSR